MQLISHFPECWADCNLDVGWIPNCGNTLCSLSGLPSVARTRGKDRAQRKKRAWETIQVLAPLLAFKEQGSGSPPQIYFHSRDWSKMLERWVIWDAGPRNSNFCHIQENSLPSHSSPPWSTFPAREYWISKVSRGQPGKIASMLAIQLIRKDRCKRRARMYMLTERDLPPACHRLALISQHAVTCLRKR